MKIKPKGIPLPTVSERLGSRYRERERTTPLLPPSGKFLHGYPITNIRFIEAFMNTKKVSALVTTISADRLSL